MRLKVCKVAVQLTIHNLSDIELAKKLHKFSKKLISAKLVKFAVKFFLEAKSVQF